MKIRASSLLHAFLLFFVTVVSSQSLQEREKVAEGNSYFLQEKYDLAKAAYAKALQINPSYFKANFNIAAVYAEQQDFQKAATHYNKVYNSNAEPQVRAAAMHNLGNAYFVQEQYAEAMKAYKQSLKLNPADNQTRYNYALAKKLLNQQQAQERNPQDLPMPSAFAKLMKEKADSMALLGQFGNAERLMTEALRQDSTVLHFKGYMDRLNEVITMDTIE